MAKYIDADLLRKEIERRITDNTFGAKLELIDILAWLDTLSEEPDKSLEEAAEEYTQKMLESWKFDSTGCRPPRESFIAGAEWQARQLLQCSPMPEDTVLFNKGVAEGRRLEREDILKDAVEADVNTYKDLVLNCGWAEFVVDMPSSEIDKFGDKVRLIVLKTEEE